MKGIALIKKQLEDAFAKFGVKEIEAAGKPYDPNLHEAILMKDSEKAPGIILEEVQKGYTMHERLIRPAMVIVSKLKEEKK
jgi:molecular chaperone GrpE